MSTPERIDGVIQLGDAILVRGSAMNELLFALNRAVETARRPGAPAAWQRRSPRLEVLHRIVLHAWKVGESPTRRDDVAHVPDPACSLTSEPDWVDTATASAHLDLSRRQVQRLAAAGYGRRIGRRAWCVDLAALTAREHAKEIDDHQDRDVA